MWLPTHIWVSAHLKRWSSAGLFCTVLWKGDHERGGILLLHRSHNGGLLLYERSLDFEGAHYWRLIAADKTDKDQRVDQKISRMRSIDPDLWAIEVDDPGGDLILDDPVRD